MHDLNRIDDISKSFIAASSQQALSIEHRLLKAISAFQRVLGVIRLPTCTYVLIVGAIVPKPIGDFGKCW
jgi:hypothetical protein